MTIPATAAEILALLAEEPLSDSQVLQLYKLTRDQLVFAMHNSEAVTQLEIRNRRVQMSDPKELLEAIEERITYYFRLVSIAGGGSQRAVAQLTRR